MNAVVATAALAVLALLALHWQRRAVLRQRAGLAVLAAQLDEARALLRALPDAVISTDPQGRVRYLNPRAEQMVGVSARRAAGQPLDELLCLHHEGAVIDLAGQLRACQEQPGAAPRRDAALGAQGGRTDVQYSCTGLARGALLALHDVSDRRSAEARLQFMAHHDGLTGLPNRLQLQLRLEHGIAYARRHGSALAVLFIDIDRFKSINDSLGHDAGDRVLSQFSQRLLHCVREVDTVARQGGDEFIVLLTELHAAQDAERVAEKIVAALAAPFQVGSHTLTVAASIGIALYPDDEEDTEALIEKADLAMYAAKQRGAGQSLRFVSSMQAKACSRMVLETALRHALEHEEFIVNYQPRLDLRRQQVTAVKALIRWKHPELGLVMPLDFLPILEDSALILPVGAWVLATAAAQARRWLERGQPLTVSVNLSARQFYQKDLAASFAAILAEAGLPGKYIELDISERILLDKNQNCDAILGQLRALGFGVAISDFGTGYASLNYLRRFPVDLVKIDKSFIDELRRGDRREAAGADHGAMVRAIIGMAHTLDMRVLASGVETRGQLAQLAAMQCDEAFGFCLSRAVSADEIDALLVSRLRRVDCISAA